MRSSATLVRNLSLFLKNLKQRSVQLWGSDRSRHARDWAVTRLKAADSRIGAIRGAHPGAFWAVVVAIVPVAIVVATAPLIWEGYSTNRVVINPIATFVGAAVLAYAALKQAATASRRHSAQTEADRQRRIVESFTQAIEQLGSDKLELRVGAIFTLERLSKESPDDYWTVMEVLTAFIRERMRHTTIMARLSERSYFLWLQAGRPEGRSEEFWREAVRLEGLEQTPTDTAAILTVIRRRSVENRRREEDKGWRFDLSGSYLSDALLERVYLKGATLSSVHLEGADLLDAHLEGADLFDSHLEGASLLNAHLEGADLREAHLEGADLLFAHLDGADLFDAHLEGASFFNAHLEGANLGGAPLEAAGLIGAHLEGANLRGANLRGAYLDKANLSGAHLEGAILLDAVGLTDDQLIETFGDEKTRLPEGITRPKTWPPLELLHPIHLGTAIAGPPVV